MRNVPAREFITGSEASCPVAARRLFEEAQASLQEGERTFVSFYGVQAMSLGFLFKAVAQLYLVNPPEVTALIEVIGLPKGQFDALQVLIDEARQMRAEASPAA